MWCVHVVRVGRGVGSLEFVEFINRHGEMWHCIAGLEGANINTLFFVHCPA